MNIEERLENVVKTLQLELKDEQDCYDLDSAEMYALVDGFNHYKNQMDVMRSAWWDYMEFLERKYPPYPGHEFELICPHHRRINEILKCTP